MTPKRKAIQFAVVNLIHCRRVRRRDLLAKGRPPYNYLPLKRLRKEHKGTHKRQRFISRGT
ncbi:MAG: hypothetical protein LBK82_04500 [Planctomycetaceae bacterium]|nr:hypothetical protein [Planctomycetaceae bacterium]